MATPPAAPSPAEQLRKQLACERCRGLGHVEVPTYAGRQVRVIDGRKMLVCAAEKCVRCSGTGKEPYCEECNNTGAVRSGPAYHYGSGPGPSLMATSYSSRSCDACHRGAKLGFAC